MKILIGIILTVVSNVAISDVVLDSVSEFSNEQGKNGWSYGYYNRSIANNAFSPNDFEELTTFIDHEGSWILQSSSNDFWTRLYSEGGHPNGIYTTQGRQPVDHWVVRRWKSDVSGDLTLEGQIFKKNTDPNGNGIVARIFVAGTEIFNQYISSSDGIGVNYSINVNVNLGTYIDFVIDPAESSDFSDGTTFTVTGNLQNSHLSNGCLATYEKGQLHIPCVVVKDKSGGEIKYEADLKYLPSPEPMIFQLLTAKQNNHIFDKCNAVYEDMKLWIPCIKVKDIFGGETMYTAKMRYKTPSKPMIFELLSAEKK